MELSSGAGHDAQSLDGITPRGDAVRAREWRCQPRDPAEHTSSEDCVDGANVLLNATIELARSASG